LEDSAPRPPKKDLDDPYQISEFHTPPKYSNVYDEPSTL
jgi:hypothetical protein